jgi:hypothetical protein
MIAARCAAVVALAVAPIAAQSWRVPRLPDGHPDFQGVWSNNTVTPFARPKALGERAPDVRTSHVAADRAS